MGKLIKESGGKSQIYAAKPRNDKFNQIICWIEEINKRLNSKNVVDFIYDISKDDLLSKYFYIENISKEINKHNLKLDFTKFGLLQDKIYKIKEGFYTEFVRIFTQLAHIKLIELDSFDNQNIYRELVSLNVDLFIVVAYRILPKKYIEIPKFGAINIHASLLPKYRGAAPIQWALMNGDASTGVSIFQIERKVDTGKIIFQEKLKIEKAKF